jgi:hypothetical protein
MISILRKKGAKFAKLLWLQTQRQKRQNKGLPCKKQRE